MTLVDSIAEVVARSDLSHDHRASMAGSIGEARAVFPSGKPVFMDKPLAASLHEAAEIVRLAERDPDAVFSASPFVSPPAWPAWRRRSAPSGAPSPTATAPANRICRRFFLKALTRSRRSSPSWVRAASRSPASTRRKRKWPPALVGGRTGVVYALRTHKTPVGTTVFGETGVRTDKHGHEEGFGPLTRAIVTFFQTRQPPLPAVDTVEIIAFMEAADQSQQRHGAPVSVRRLLAAEGF